jgi:pantoate--beta-alanine ligase
LLHHAGADFVFIPETQDFYANTAAVELDIHPLDSVFEGKFRPGHFKGVVDVLHRFFSIVRPTDVFMGLKDLQQCLVVEKLIHEYYADMKQHNCETRREPSGLAMSSRNVRLSDQGRLKANGIYAELQYLREHKMQFDTFVNTSLRNLRTLGFETEYLSMVSLPNLKKVTDPESEKAAIIFAGHLEGVRLIDNLLV